MQKTVPNCTEPDYEYTAHTYLKHIPATSVHPSEATPTHIWYLALSFLIKNLAGQFHYAFNLDFHND